MSAAPTGVFNIDPLLSLRVDATAIADLAFGSLSRSPDSLAGRHLAFLPAETLELDLTDPAQRQFGDYELLELIGEGGMGVVYRARQTSLDREVAVKLLAAGPWASREFVERFRREAQNAARMQHPNIVAIYEVGSAEELHFFSMRLVRGYSLAGLIKHEGKLPALRAAALLRTIAEAVDYAHRLGVLHLDLKPANVLLDENGTPYVADFGLARRLEQGLAADNDEVSGTPSYMAPEQATAGAQKITPATDIWGLGAILYELVSAQPPFLGDSAQATLKLVVEGTALSPRAYVPELSHDLEAIILKCMTREVASRYPTARALADDLGRFIENRPVQARRLNGAQRVWRWAKRQPNLAAFGLLFAISLSTGIVGVTTQWRRAEGNAARAQSSAAAARSTLWESRRDSAGRQQLDGKGFDALPGLLANIDEQERAGVTEPGRIERREVGAVLNQGVTLIDRMILPDASPMAVALSPDGGLMAVALNDFTVRWYDTKTLRERGRVDLEGLPTSDAEPRVPMLLRFVNDQRLRVTLEWFDFVTNPSGDDSFLVDLDRAEVVALPAKFVDPTDAVYSADGHYALLRNTHHEIQLWQVEPWQPLSPKFAEPRHHEYLPWALGRDARFAIAFNSDMSSLDIYDPRHWSASRRLTLQENIAVTAWAERSDGSALALGDATGRVFLLDLRTLALRQLPTPVGREVTWLAFSEDDAWLAVVRWDGAAYAFDVASGNALIAGQMQHDFQLRNVSINHRQRLLVASGPGATGPGQTQVWRLPEPGPYGTHAAALISSPTRSAPNGYYATGTSSQSGLLATAAIDGEVRLWRLPASPTLPMRTSLQLPGMLYFDGAHVVDTEYTKLRIASVTGATPTPWVDLPQPVDFAALLDQARTLVATAGPTLYVFDAAMNRRYPPLQLPANPQRLVATADGATAVLAFGSEGAMGFEERLQGYDLKTGQRRAGEAVLDGPLRQLELSPDGSRLLTTGPVTGSTDIFETATLRRLGSYRHDPKTPVLWAAFAPESGLILLATRSDDPRADDGSLIFWDPVADSVRERRPLHHAWQIAVTAALGHSFVAGRDQDLLDPGTADERSAQRLSRDEATAVLAVSHDGHLIAHAFRREVQLYDTATATAVGAPLHSDINPADGIFQLAFAPDDRQLLAGTALGHWLVWPVAADTRPLAQIREDAELLVPQSGGRHVVQLPGAAESDRLRRHDPGAWRSSDPRPLPAAAREVAGESIPVRDPHASPLLLDLTDAYTLAPDSVLNFVRRVFAIVRPFPLGIVRLDGVDYDVRGATELRWGKGGGSQDAHNPPQSVTGIRVPQTPIAAFHVLMFAPEAEATTLERIYATVRLHYRDGSSAVLPIRTQREVPGWSDLDRPVPFAWVHGDQLRLFGFSKQNMISDPRLPNPHPERPIATLDLEAAKENWSTPVFFAVTAEPFAKLRAGSVIAAANSGIKIDDGGLK